MFKDIYLIYSLKDMEILILSGWLVTTALILSQVSVALDSGMIVIIFIVVLLLTLLFTMFSSVDNNWCNLLFPNGTVSYKLDQVSILCSDCTTK